MCNRTFVNTRGSVLTQRLSACVPMLASSSSVSPTRHAPLSMSLCLHRDLCLQSDSHSQHCDHESLYAHIAPLHSASQQASLCLQSDSHSQHCIARFVRPSAAPPHGAVGYSKHTYYPYSPTPTASFQSRPASASLPEPRLPGTGPHIDRRRRGDHTVVWARTLTVGTASLCGARAAAAPSHWRGRRRPFASRSRSHDISRSRTWSRDISRSRGRSCDLRAKLIG